MSLAIHNLNPLLKELNDALLLEDAAPVDWIVCGGTAINRLIRDSNRAFEVGDCEQVRTAFSEANRFTEGGGSLHDAVGMISERLRISSSAPTPQPPSRHPTASPNPH